MPDINTKVKITGESEYRDALKNINASMKTLNSEMKLTSAQFAGNEKSIEALRAKNEVLNKSIAQQEEKLRLMREQLKKTAEAYGEGSEKTQKLQAAVNDAETELVKMKNSLNENEKAMNKSDKSMEKMKKTTALVAAGFVAVTKALIDVEKKLFSMAKEAAQAADELQTLAMKTGLSTEELQKFQYASELVDVSVDTLQGSLTKLTTNINKAAEGSGDAAKTFEALGVEIKDEEGHLRSANDVFLDAIDALGQIENQTERDATAMSIFGKSAQDLNPLIQAGSEELNKLGLEAEEAGYILSTDALKALTDMDDQMQRLNKTQEALKNQIAAEFAPYATKALENVTEAFKALADMVKKSGVVEAFGMLLEDVTAIIRPVDELSNSKLPVLQKALNGVAVLCAAIADTVSIIANLIGFVGNVDKFNFSGAKSNLSNIKTSLGLTGNNRIQQVTNLQKGWTYDSATGEWRDPNVLYGNAVLDQYYGTSVTSASTPTHYSSWEAYEAAHSGDTINVTIDASSVQEFNDIVDMAKSARTKLRKERGG